MPIFFHGDYASVFVAGSYLCGVKDFDPYYPYYAYRYREANAWNSLFFAPHNLLKQGKIV